MKSDDPIMHELREVKEALAKAQDYDATKLAAHIRAREEKAGKRRPQAPKRASRQRKAS